jgi:hypothetical protein
MLLEQLEAVFSSTVETADAQIIEHDGQLDRHRQHLRPRFVGGVAPLAKVGVVAIDHGRFAHIVFVHLSEHTTIFSTCAYTYHRCTWGGGVSPPQIGSKWAEFPTLPRNSEKYFWTSTG